MSYIKIYNNKDYTHSRELEIPLWFTAVFLVLLIWLIHTLYLDKLFADIANNRYIKEVASCNLFLMDHFAISIF